MLSKIVYLTQQNKKNCSQNKLIIEVIIFKPLIFSSQQYDHLKMEDEDEKKTV